MAKWRRNAQHPQVILHEGALCNEGGSSCKGAASLWTCEHLRRQAGLWPYSRNVLLTSTALPCSARAGGCPA